MRGTPLRWTRCLTCDRAVLVVTARDAADRPGAEYVGTHWMVPSRRCPASQTRITEAHARVATLEELPR